MSGLEGQKFTHDVTERLSYYLFAAVSDRRPNYRTAQIEMKETCKKCHTSPRIDAFYKEAESVVGSVNEYVGKADAVMKALREEKLLTPAPMDEPIELLHFDLWHYGGRTAKHGAFMGGADFVQWHGFYEVYSKLRELERMAGEIREKRSREAGADAK
jgi:hypothetical protein